MDMTIDHYKALEAHLYPVIYDDAAVEKMGDHGFATLDALVDLEFLKLDIVMGDQKDTADTLVKITQSGTEHLRTYRESERNRASKYVDEALF